MPDFNQYSVKEPVQRPELPIGLSQIVYPITPPAETGGAPDTSQDEVTPFWKGQGLEKYFSGVPTSPGAATPYQEARKYNKPDLLFLPNRDNEDLYAQNQTWYNSIGHGVGRLVALTGTKLGTGLGYAAGLTGLGNDPDKYGGGFAGWIAGAADNGFAKWFEKQEDDVKTDYFPIYKKATEKDHGFFRHLGDLDAWTDDLTDGLAFVASSFVPGMAISKLELGANVLRSLQLVRGLGYADEAAALSEEGLTGEALTKEGQAALQTEKAKNIITKADGSQEIPRIIKGIDNASIERGINVGSTSVINTASQAMFSANDTKLAVYDELINKKDAKGNNVYTNHQANQIAAKVARDSYLMNLGALGLMNLFEANLIFKDAKPLSSKYGAGNIKANGIFNDAELAKQTFGERASGALKEPVKGTLTAGVWLGNLQLAIDRLNNNPDNFNLDFGDKLKGLSKQYFKQLSDAVTGADTDAAKAIGIGGILGGVLGKVFGEKGEKQKQLDVLNSQMNAFKDLGNIYKTDEQGKIDMTAGTPVLDEVKLKSFVASMNNVLSLNQLAKNFDGRGVKELAKVYKDEVFARFAKAHFDQGLGELLNKKLDDISNISKEDLAMLGYDPDTKNEDVVVKVNDLKERAKSLEQIYNNINQNFVSADINTNTKAGRDKQFKITDKLFYLSSRAKTLNELIKSSRTEYERVKTSADDYDAAFNATSDAAVNQYNELFENVQAAKKNADVASNLYLGGLSDAIRDYYAGTNLGYTSDETVKLYQDRLDEFVNNNKEVLEKLKKDSRGRYLFEIANKNLLPSAKELERQQIIQAEASVAHNATLNVMGRLADPKFGAKYYDQVYSKEYERHAQEAGVFEEETPDEENTKKLDSFYKDPSKDVTKLKSTISEDDINRAYTETVDNAKPTNKNEIVDYLAEKVSKGQELTDKEEAIRQALNEDVESRLQSMVEKKDYGEMFDELNDLEKRRDELEEKEDKTVDEEQELENLNNQITALQSQVDDKGKQEQNNIKVDYSDNIKPQDKEQYKGILNKIGLVRKQVKKFDNHYEVNGQTYNKVTSLIGDTISDEQRQDPATQAATSIGNTIDAVTKAYFGGTLNDEFRLGLSDKMSPETYQSIVKSLDAIKQQLANKGIEILDSNVFLTDDVNKVAGEIDLLGVDKDGNFKIYEIQARRPDIYRQYGIRGKGIKIRDVDGKRLTMYRNMFANQYGAIPDEIAVKFPFEVKYDKTNPVGFIEKAKLREPIRFQPLKNVQIKMKNSEPLKIGSRFNSVDMTRIFLDTFLPTKEQGDKLKFLFRNVPLKEVFGKVKLTVKPAEPEFQERFEKQRQELTKEKVPTKSDIKVTEVIPYTTPEANKFKPEEQLKFNQGNNYEPIRIVASKEMIDLIRYGSELTKMGRGEKSYGTGAISDEYGARLEKQFGISGRDAYNKARELAKENRGSTENIIKLSHFPIENTSNEEGFFKIKKFRDYKNRNASGEPREFPNLYSLVGNTELSLDYEGTPIGYMSPLETMAYKDIDGKFKILDENTDAKTYSEVTGNDINTYPEFKKIATAYKRLYTELTNRMNASPEKSITLTGKDLADLIDFKPSVGELDLVKRNQDRPNLSDLSISGVKVGGKSVPTTVTVDDNGAVKVLMDKGKKNRNLINKYQEVDRWANQNLDDIKKAMHDKNGNKVADAVAIIETPTGDYKPIALKTKGDFNPDNFEDFVDNLGLKYSSATTKQVFKNENIMVIPKDAERTIDFGIREKDIISAVYPTEDVQLIAEVNPKPDEVHLNSTEQQVQDFLNNANEQTKQDLTDMGLNSKEAIINDFTAGEWSSIEDYLLAFKNCK